MEPKNAQNVRVQHITNVEGLNDDQNMDGTVYVKRISLELLKPLIGWTVN